MVENEGDLLRRKTLGFEGDLTKGNALKEWRQNSEEVLGVEILSDTTLTEVGIFSSLTMSILNTASIQTLTNLRNLSDTSSYVNLPFCFPSSSTS